MRHASPIYDPFLNQVGSRFLDNPLPTLPIIGVDECANNRWIDQLTTHALRENLTLLVYPLWHQLHKTDDGHTSMYSGNANNAVRKQLGLGTPVCGHSWPDKYVVQLLVAQFGASTNVVLLTENRRRDQGGLHRILGEVIGPALCFPEYQHLSLSILMKRGKTSWPDYAHQALIYLRAQPIQRGYTYLEL